MHNQTLCLMNKNNWSNVKQADIKQRLVKMLLKLSRPNKMMCKNCQFGKMEKSSLKRIFYSFDDVLKLVHIDSCGPIGVQR